MAFYQHTLYMMVQLEMIDRPSHGIVAKNGWLTDAYSLAKTFLHVFCKKFMNFEGRREEAPEDHRGELVAECICG